MVREAGSVIIKTGYTLPETNSEFFPEHQGGWKMKFPNLGHKAYFQGLKLFLSNAFVEGQVAGGRVGL